MALAPEPSYDDGAWSALTADPAIAARRGAVETDDAEAWSALLPRLRARHGLSLGRPGERACRERARPSAAARPRPGRTWTTSSTTGSCPSASPAACSTLSPPCSTRPAAWLERAGAGPAAPATRALPPPGRGSDAEQRLEVIADAMLADAGRLGRGRRAVPGRALVPRHVEVGGAHRRLHLGERSAHDCGKQLRTERARERTRRARCAASTRGMRSRARGKNIVEVGQMPAGGAGQDASCTRSTQGYARLARGRRSAPGGLQPEQRRRSADPEHAAS